jgi:tripartite-type tricarboxylate transporter receptor subunit TctC
LLFPAGTPRTIAARVSADAVNILSTAEARTRLETLGYTPSGMTPAAFAALMAAEKKRWTALINEAGIKAD